VFFVKHSQEILGVNLVQGKKKGWGIDQQTDMKNCLLCGGTITFLSQLEHHSCGNK
jgi:hypothetical protein